MTGSIDAPIDPPSVRVHCEKLVAGGEALARDAGGRVVLVAGGAPDEVVDVAVTSTRRGVSRGVIVTVVEPSTDRVVPPCPQVVRGCGGCDWQHLAVPAQRHGRRGIVAESLRRIGRLPGDRIEAALAAGIATAAGPSLPESGVRTTMRFALDTAGRPGLRAARSHEVVPTSTCLVAHPALEELLGHLVLPGVQEVTIRVGGATGERALWWSPAEVAPAAPLPADVRLGADAIVHDIVAGVTLRVSAGSFFQPSTAAAEAIVAAVRRASADALTAMSPEELVVDAYAGVGLLAATVVPGDRAVLAVEGSRAACADAEVNLAGRPARVLRCSVERWRAEPAALVIADPSRSGLGVDACRRLLASDPRDMVLVSCDPASLGRDAALLAQAGFDLVSCEVLDAFPHTHHVETVSRFTRPS